MYKFFLIQFFFAVFWVFSFAGAVSAAERQAILTWSAESFVPSSYEGRALSSLRSRVEVSAMLLEDGKVIDLSRADVSWFLDNQPHQKGRGLQEISFQVNKAEGNVYNVSASVSLRGSVTSGAIQIPVVKPQVVLTHPYPRNIVPPGSKVPISAHPYFFSASSLQDLGFGWQIDNQPIFLSGGDSLLNLAVGNTPGGRAEVAGFAKRSGRNGKTAKQILRLYISL